eukprot:4971878-Pleurochrysis_carterae.AAC.1
MKAPAQDLTRNRRTPRAGACHLPFKEEHLALKRGDHASAVRVERRRANTARRAQQHLAPEANTRARRTREAGGSALRVVTRDSRKALTMLYPGLCTWYVEYQTAGLCLCVRVRVVHLRVRVHAPLTTSRPMARSVQHESGEAAITDSDANQKGNTDSMGIGSDRMCSMGVEGKGEERGRGGVEVKSAQR